MNLPDKIFVLQDLARSVTHTKPVGVEVSHLVLSSFPDNIKVGDDTYNREAIVGQDLSRKEFAELTGESTSLDVTPSKRTTYTRYAGSEHL